jgi:hypothetical protein
MGKEILLLAGFVAVYVLLSILTTLLQTPPGTLERNLHRMTTTQARSSTK